MPQSIIILIAVIAIVAFIIYRILRPRLKEEKPSDEGEFLKSYVADYRRIQEYGE